MRKMRQRRLDDVAMVNQKVWISKEEVRATIKRLRSGKVVGPDDIAMEAWRCFGVMGVEVLTKLFNTVLKVRGSLRSVEEVFCYQCFRDDALR